MSLGGQTAVSNELSEQCAMVLELGFGVLKLLLEENVQFSSL